MLLALEVFQIKINIKNLQTLLPRGQNPNHLRDRNEEVNKILHEYVRGNSLLQLVSIEKGFVQTDGTISNHDMSQAKILSRVGLDMQFLLKKIINFQETN